MKAVAVKTNTYQFAFHTLYFTWVFREKSTSSKDDFAAKTSLTVSSIMFCQEIFDES